MGVYRASTNASRERRCPTPTGEGYQWNVLIRGLTDLLNDVLDRSINLLTAANEEESLGSITPHPRASSRARLLFRAWHI